MVCAMNPWGLTGGPDIGAFSAALSHPGLVREQNEDAYLRDDRRGIWAVVDGMGGHACGEVASAVVVEHIDNIRTRWPTASALAVDVISRLEDANTLLRRQARDKGVGTMGATVACLVSFQGKALATWCGDCRIYRFRDHLPICLVTHDHTLVQQLVDEGELRPEEAENHPEAHVLTRAVGAADRLELDFQQLDLMRGDRFLLCSDGLSRSVPDSEIEAACHSEGGPHRICALLLERALDAGAPDNVTISVVEFG